MWQRGLLGLLLAAGLLLAGWGLVHVGCGPYTVVYGPATALRAQRAFLFLTLILVALAALVPAAIPLHRWSPTLRIFFADRGADLLVLPSPACGLRC
jgi:hypothetical protein